MPDSKQEMLAIITISIKIINYNEENHFYIPLSCVTWMGIFLILLEIKMEEYFLKELKKKKSQASNIKLLGELQLILQQGEN